MKLRHLDPTTTVSVDALVYGTIVSSLIISYAFSHQMLLAVWILVSAGAFYLAQREIGSQYAKASSEKTEKRWEGRELHGVRTHALRYGSYITVLAALVFAVHFKVVIAGTVFLAIMVAAWLIWSIHRDIRAVDSYRQKRNK